MIKLFELLTKVDKKVLKENLEIGSHLSILCEDSELFQELSDPNFAYRYVETSPNRWQFNDRYGNSLGVQYHLSNRYVDTFYVVRDKSGKSVEVFDYEQQEDAYDKTSFTGGTDQHRSDTICKILRDEIVPRYLINKKPSLIKIHPLNKYRYAIFLKCLEICKEKYTELEIKELAGELYLINK